MAQTEHLPIYKRTYDLCLYLEQVVRDVALDRLRSGCRRSEIPGQR